MKNRFHGPAGPRSSSWYTPPHQDSLHDRSLRQSLQADIRGGYIAPSRVRTFLDPIEAAHVASKLMGEASRVFATSAWLSSAKENLVCDGNPTGSNRPRHSAGRQTTRFASFVSARRGPALPVINCICRGSKGACRFETERQRFGGSGNVNRSADGHSNAALAAQLLRQHAVFFVATDRLEENAGWPPFATNPASAS